MQGTALEKLFFTIALIDRVSKPAKGVRDEVMALQKTARAGFMEIGQGALAIGATAASLNAFTGPARDVQQALNETASLGTPIAELEKLRGAANRFAMDYGGDAAAVIRSSYAIQSALPNLAEGALAAFTEKSAILARATLADEATMSNYMATMYHIFQKDANRLGDATWIDQLAGKSAHAIKIFKTSGSAMDAAFANLGSNATIAGIRMEEQMAVLGTLQGTMSGEQAGTAYAAFLNSTGKAAKMLGLNLRDGEKNLRPMTEIIGELRTKFADANGKINDVGRSKMIRAFGTTGAKAVLNLMNKTDALNSSIGELTGIDGSNPAVEMAQKMNDSAKVFSSVLKVIKTQIGGSILPIVDFLLNVLSFFLRIFSWMLDTIPPLRWAIAALVIAVSALSAALGTLWVAMGAKKVIDALMMKFNLLHKLARVYVQSTHAGTFANKAAIAVLWVKNTVMGRTIAGQKIYNALLWVWEGLTKKGLLLDRMQAIYTTVKTVMTRKHTFSLGANIAALNAANVAQYRGIVADRLFTFGKWLLNAALIAGKAILLLGMIPAMIAYVGALVVAKATVWAFQLALLAFKGVMLLLKGALIIAKVAVWAFNVALYANPIGLIVLAVVALIAAIVAIVYWWDEWTGFADRLSEKMGIFSGLLYNIPILGQILLIRDLVKWIGKLIDSFDGFGAVCDLIAAPFEAFFSWLWEKISLIPNLFKGAVEKVSWLWDWIPGLGGEKDPTPPKVEPAPVVESVAATRSQEAPGIAAGPTTNNTTNYGGVNIYPRSITPRDFEENRILAGGL